MITETRAKTPAVPCPGLAAGGLRTQLQGPARIPRHWHTGAPGRGLGTQLVVSELVPSSAQDYSCPSFSLFPMLKLLKSYEREDYQHYLSVSLLLEQNYNCSRGAKRGAEVPEQELTTPSCCNIHPAKELVLRKA